MNLFRTISSFYQNQYVNPHTATLRHLGWQFRKGFNLFPHDVVLDTFKVRIADRSIANGSGALLNALGYYDPNNMYFLQELFEKRLFSSFFDVGANIGIYSLIVASTKNAKVIAFEPHPYTYALFRENVILNEFEERISSFQYAVGEENGNVYLTDQPGSAINHILENTEKQRKELLVKLVRGDTFCYTNNIYPSVMKIDVEGYENNVLQGFGSLLEELQLILVECRSIKQTSIILCEGFGFLGPYKMDYQARRFTRANFGDEDWIFINPQTIETLKSAGFFA